MPSSGAILCSLCCTLAVPAFCEWNCGKKHVGMSSAKWASKESMNWIPTWEKLQQKCAKCGSLKGFLWDAGAVMLIWEVRSQDKICCKKVLFADRPDCVGVTPLSDFSRLEEWGRAGPSCRYVWHFLCVQRAFPSGCVSSSYAPQPIWLPTAAGLFLVSGMQIIEDMIMASCQQGDRFSPQNISLCG